MPDGEVWEDEVAGLAGTVEVGDARHWDTGENRTRSRLTLDSAVGIWTSPLERGEEEEVGVVGEGDIGLLHVVVWV